MNNPRQRRSLPRALRSVLPAACLALLAGCASTHDNPDDPLEGYNRAMFTFNEHLDRAVLKPVAEAYDCATPLPVRSGVGNFFGNIDDLWTGANNVLQGKFREGLSDFGRVLINTTVGILGIFDVATEMGIEAHSEDFGQTLGRWGVGEGAYFVLPVFGPRTIRDSGALVLDLAATSAWSVHEPALQNGASGLRFINTRANLLAVDKVLEEGALDRYTYVREAYLQKRRYDVYDGSPPRNPDDDFDYRSSSTPGIAAVPGTVAAIAAVSRIDASRVDDIGAPRSLPIEPDTSENREK